MPPVGPKASLVLYPAGAWLAARGRRRSIAIATILIALFGPSIAPLFAAGLPGAAAMLILGFGLT